MKIEEVFIVAMVAAAGATITVLIPDFRGADLMNGITAVGTLATAYAAIRIASQQAKEVREQEVLKEISEANSLCRLIVAEASQIAGQRIIMADLVNKRETALHISASELRHFRELLDAPNLIFQSNADRIGILRPDKIHAVMTFYFYEREDRRRLLRHISHLEGENRVDSPTAISREFQASVAFICANFYLLTDKLGFDSTRAMSLGQTSLVRVYPGLSNIDDAERWREIIVSYATTHAIPANSY